MTATWMVNEKTTLFLRISFFDEDGVATTPEAAWFRIDDVSSGTRIVPADASPTPSPTAEPDGMIPLASPMTSVVDLEITAEQNQMVVQHAGSDERIVTVEFDYDSGGGHTKHGAAEYHYWIKGLAHVK